MKKGIRENRNAFIRANGRIAGDGIISDDYSEESGNTWRTKGGKVRFPNDKRDPRSLNGPVIIVQEGRKQNG